LDEAWFVLVHVTIEAQAGPGLAALQPLQAAAQAQDEKAVLAHLTTLAAAIDTMLITLDRMYEHCDPYVYYHRVRPYMFGWRNNPVLPGGLIYEGVDAFGGRPVEFYGETGAQSTVIPSIDAALGIAHASDEMRVYLRAMLDYVPPAHRAFVHALEAGPSVRDYVMRSGTAALRDAYNGCVARVEAFRGKHLQLAADYIFKQNKDAALGTGGTSFMTYLGKHRQETRASLLPGGEHLP
jgi:indoleamine 2,3-dioxygenase